MPRISVIHYLILSSSSLRLLLPLLQIRDICRRYSPRPVNSQLRTIRLYFLLNRIRLAAAVNIWCNRLLTVRNMRKVCELTSEPFPCRRQLIMLLTLSFTITRRLVPHHLLIRPSLQRYQMHCWLVLWCHLHHRSFVVTRLSSNQWLGRPFDSRLH